MNEIILIKVLLFFEICRMSLKCLKNFPQEYFKETAFMAKYIFSYSGFMITLLVFVFIEKISQFLYIDEADLFAGICLAIGFFAIGISDSLRERAELDYKFKNKPFDSEYRNNLIRRNLYILIEAIMLLGVIFFYKILPEM
mgnify:FL=1